MPETQPIEPPSPTEPHRSKRPRPLIGTPPDTATSSARQRAHAEERADAAEFEEHYPQLWHALMAGATLRKIDGAYALVIKPERRALEYLARHKQGEYPGRYLGLYADEDATWSDVLGDVGPGWPRRREADPHAERRRCRASDARTRGRRSVRSPPGRSGRLRLRRRRTHDPHTIRRRPPSLGRVWDRLANPRLARVNRSGTRRPAIVPHRRGQASRQGPRLEGGPRRPQRSARRPRRRRHPGRLARQHARSPRGRQHNGLGGLSATAIGTSPLGALHDPEHLRAALASKPR